MSGAILAVDLGTTTIAASILDERSGERLAFGVELNPQRRFGADVVSRISAAVMSDDLRREMSTLVNTQLENLACRLLSQSGLNPEALSKVAIAGNPAMEHLLLGLPVDSLAKSPYRPIFTDGKTLHTRDLGWETGAETYMFPLPGGFVGGDLVALLFGQLDGSPSLTSDASSLFLDLGTNAEIALVRHGIIVATSAAAGPAFEGASLVSGMLALPGAVSSLAIHGDTVKLETIGEASPEGICGAGALSAVASLLDAGLLDVSGSLLPPEQIPSNLANRMMLRNGEPAFLVYRDAGHEIVLTQSDIRELQLAKGAIRGGIEVLFDRAGVRGNDIVDIVVSGSFGTSVRDDCLKTLGIIPEKVSGNVMFAENGVLRGVEKCMLDRGGVAGVNAISAAIKVVPLSGSPLFERLYLSHMNFPSRKGSE